MDLFYELGQGPGPEGWSKDKLGRLQAAAIAAQLRGCPGQRGLAWRLFLNVLPQAAPHTDWRRLVEAKREQYSEFKKQHYPDFDKATKAVDDPLSSLSLGEEEGGRSAGGWKQYYADLELIDEIKKDLHRLYPSGCDEQHFMAAAVQELMLGVLFVWASLHKATSYRQGMHEVLAVILYALQQEGAEGGVPARLSWLLDPSFIEHDVFAIFDTVMMELEPLYFYQKVKGSTEEAPLIRLCNRVQGEVLRQVDPELHRHLHDLSVTPQLYGIKWFRLLFSREFLMQDVLVLWDYIFACRHRASSSSSDLQASIEVVAIAMMTANRSELLSDDQSVVLRRLLSYNSAVDVSHVIAQAEALRRKGGPLPPPPTLPTVMTSTSAEPPPSSSTSSSSSSSSSSQAAASKPSSSGAGSGRAEVPFWLKGFTGSGMSSTAPASTLRDMNTRVTRSLAAVASDVVDRAQQSIISTTADLTGMRRRPTVPADGGPVVVGNGASSSDRPLVAYGGDGDGEEEVVVPLYGDGGQGGRDEAALGQALERAVRTLREVVLGGGGVMLDDGPARERAEAAIVEMERVRDALLLLPRSQANHNHGSSSSRRRSRPPSLSAGPGPHQPVEDEPAPLLVPVLPSFSSSPAPPPVVLDEPPPSLAPPPSSRQQPLLDALLDTDNNNTSRLLLSPSDLKSPPPSQQLQPWLSSSSSSSPLARADSGGAGGSSSSKAKAAPMAAALLDEVDLSDDGPLLSSLLPTSSSLSNSSSGGGGRPRRPSAANLFADDGDPAAWLGAGTSSSMK